MSGNDVLSRISCRRCGHADDEHHRGCQVPQCGCPSMELILTVGDALAAIADGVDDWEVLTYRLARNDLPVVLTDLCDATFFADDPRQLGRAVIDAWVMCEFPENALDRGTWLHWFETIGYTVNAEPADRPEAVVLYRGGRSADRMAWTSNRAVAEWFRDRWPDGKLWTATARGDQLLAHVNNVRLDDSGQSEDEYVVNPAGLKAHPCQ